MRRIILGALLIAGTYSAGAQKYMTRNGRVTFFSSTALENIEAFNNDMAGVLDSKTGDFAFQVPIKSFKFEKALMQEHFNESYLESDKYPKATYTGKVTDINSVNFGKDGSYNVNTTGKLTIHGVTQDVTIPGTITVKGTSINIAAKFSAKTADYKISIPNLMKEKVAKVIEVNLSGAMQQK